MLGILTVISYNEEARPMLLRARAHEALIHLMLSKDGDIETVAAAIGVSILSFHLLLIASVIVSLLSLSCLLAQN